MSILAFKPKELTIPTEILQRCFDSVKDSVGFSYINNRSKKIITHRRFKSFDSFLRFYQKVKNSACLINFAEQEHGLKNYCGPFKIDNNHVMIHYGRIWDLNSLTIKDQSQSANLAKMIRLIWNPILFKKDYLKWIIEEALDSDNIIIIMNNLGEAQIFNENKGFKLNGCFLSKIPTQKQIGFTTSHVNTFNDSRTRYTYPSGYGSSIKCDCCESRYFHEKLSWISGMQICNNCKVNGRFDRFIQEKKNGLTSNHNVSKTDTTKTVRNNPNTFLIPVIHDPNYVNVFDMI